MNIFVYGYVNTYLDEKIKIKCPIPNKMIKRICIHKTKQQYII